jgi:hypothetical protein
LQLGAQERDEYSRSLNIDFDFKPQDVITAADLLDPQEVEEVIAFGFPTFLNLKVGTICERKETNSCLKLVDLDKNTTIMQLQNMIKV